VLRDEGCGVSASQYRAVFPDSQGGESSNFDRLSCGTIWPAFCSGDGAVIGCDSESRADESIAALSRRAGHSFPTFSSQYSDRIRVGGPRDLSGSGSVVVNALYYKLERRGFDTRGI
jgi:hypothetical protein